MSLPLKRARQLAITSTLVWAVAVFYFPLSAFESIWYDLGMRLSVKPVAALENRVVIIDIDEKSLAEQGRWPWPRTQIASLMKTLANYYQAPIIGVDILFPDSTTEDDLFYQEISGLPVTFAQAFAFEQNDEPTASAVPILSRGHLKSEVALDTTIAVPQASGYIASTTGRHQNHWQAGHITPHIDSDGKVRKIAPLIEWQGHYYEMLALSLARQLYGLSAEYKIVSGEPIWGASYQLNNGPFEIDLDTQGYAWIPYPKQLGKQIMYVSAADVLSRSAPMDAIEGKVVIIGSTAVGLYDQIATPLEGAYPAVELHASLLSALFDKAFYAAPQWEKPYLILMLSLLLIIVLRGFNGRRPLLTLCLLLSLTFIGMAVSILCWGHKQIRIWPILLQTATLLTIYIPAVLWHQLQQRKAIQALFSAYVPHPVVEQLLKQPENAIGITPVKQQLSVLFADCKGFTGLAERMEPDQLGQYMKRVFDAMTDIVHQQGGTVDKYMGDALMAFWGAPLHDEKHAEHAVKAAQGIQAAISQLSDQFAAQGLPIVEVGIGVNTGEVVVGDMGSSFRSSYTVIGDTVNQAARLQKMTRQLGYSILVGEMTFNAVSADIQGSMISLGQQKIAGRQQTVQVFACKS